MWEPVIRQHVILWRRIDTMLIQNTIIDLVSELIKIDSSNSWLIPGSPGEKNVQLSIQEYFRKLGIETYFEEIDERHSNLVGCIKGGGGGKSLTLYAHCDTVGYALWKERALVPCIKGDHLIGLGAADDKGHAAAIMLSLTEIIESEIKLRGDINICLVSDEEGTSCGAMEYVKKHTPGAALVLESAPINRINISHQGFGWLDIKVKGNAAHGSASEAGIDAIIHMAEVIVRLQRNKRELFEKNPHPLNGETVFHTGTIAGGTDYATYPDYCQLGIEIGIQPGETIENRICEIEKIFKEVKQIYPGFEGSVDIRIARNPFEAKGHDVLYEILSVEIEKITHKKAVAVGENSWGDAQLFQDAGFPTLGVGANGGNLHAPDEWISISELEQLIQILISVIVKFCA